MSELEFRPIHKIFRDTTASIKYAKITSSDTKAFHVYNNSPLKINLLLGLLGYFDTNATLYPTQEKA